LVIVKREHALKTLGVIQDINVLEGDVALCVSLTGFARVGSEILTEDENLFHKNRARDVISGLYLCLNSLSPLDKLQAFTPCVSLSERLMWRFESLSRK